MALPTERTADGRRGGRRLRDEVSVRLFVVALVPFIVAAALRILFFADDTAVTVMLLGPAVEESLKLAGVLLVLTLVAVAARGGRDPEMALRYWLVLAPWLVGWLYGMMEGLLVYPGQGGLDFTLRELAHGTFVALGLGTALAMWRLLSAPLFGAGFGFAAAFSAHFGFNTLAVIAYDAGLSFVDQALYLAVIAFLAIVVFAVELRHEPASAEARAFVPSRGRGPQP